MTFRQFAVNWISKTTLRYPTIMWDLAELFGNYPMTLEYMEIVINQLQKLVAAWKEYQEK